MQHKLASGLNLVCLLLLRAKNPLVGNDGSIPKLMHFNPQMPRYAGPNGSSSQCSD